MKKLTLLLIALMSISFIAKSQAPNVKYLVCKRPAGQDCNSSSPAISCATEYSTLGDPCTLYEYYTVDENGNEVELKCYSYQYGLPKSDNPYVFGGHNFLPADTSLELEIQCDGTGPYVTWYDFSSIASSFNRPGVNFRQDGDTLFVNIYDTDSLAPFIKSGTLTTLSYTSDFFDGLCTSGVPAILGKEEPIIYRIAKLGLKHLTNPVENGVLSFSFINQEAISDLESMEIIDQSGKVIKKIKLSELTSSQEKQNINIKDVGSGNYILLISSKKDKATYNIVVP